MTPFQVVELIVKAAKDPDWDRSFVLMCEAGDALDDYVEQEIIRRAQNDRS